MAKTKQWLYAKKDTDKRKPADPETANDFLEAGVEHEEAGEKWRGGDAAKSLRFFVRAIDTYDVGLQRYPGDFDLAYNKARLQYEVAQQPRLLAHLPASLDELLQEALRSHHYAVSIDQDNADLLFNTAQVLTSLAEAITEGTRSSDDSRTKALKLLQESLEFSQRCLNVQEYQLNQDQEFEATTHQHGQMQQSSEKLEEQDDENEVSRATKGTPTSSADRVVEETWATVVDPITPASLLDTIIAQVETLTVISTLEASSAAQDWPLGWVEEYHQTILQTKLFALASTTSRQHEARLAEAKFRCALADAAYRSARIDLPTYRHEVQESFQPFAMDCNDPQALCDRADAELTLYASIRQQRHQKDQESSSSLPDSSETSADSQQDFNKISWKHITTALDSLTAASKLPAVLQHNLARIHLQRGDCELQRLSLGESPSRSDLALQSASVLLGNAGLYYRMAGRQASSEGTAAMKEEGREAYVKELVVSMLATNNTATATADGGVGGGEGEDSWKGVSSESTRADIQAMVNEMGEEGILGQEGAAKVIALIS